MIFVSSPEKVAGFYLDLVVQQFYHPFKQEDQIRPECCFLIRKIVHQNLVETLLPRTITFG